jgi:hypothetical protein
VVHIRNVLTLDDARRFGRSAASSKKASDLVIGSGQRNVLDGTEQRFDGQALLSRSKGESAMASATDTPHRSICAGRPVSGRLAASSSGKEYLPIGPIVFRATARNKSRFDEDWTGSVASRARM